MMQVPIKYVGGNVKRTSSHQKRRYLQHWQNDNQARSVTNIMFIFLLMFGIMLMIGPEQTHGLKISGSTSSVLTYSLEACPSGWESLDADSQYNGRVIKGTASVGEGGVLSSEPAHSSSSKIPSHRHNTDGAIDYKSVEEENPYRVQCGTPRSVTAASNGANTGIGNVLQSSTQEFYSAVHLNLCRLTSGDYYLPPGIVFFLAPGVGSCPVGSSSFSPGNGRVFVFASQSRSLSSSVESPAPPVSSGVSIGIHSHTHPQTVLFSASTSVAVPTTSSGDCRDPLGSFIPRYAPSDTIQFTKISNDADTYRSIGVPYVQLLTCLVTTDTGSEFSRPHRDMIFYSSLNQCPEGWEDVTTRTDGPTPAPYSGLAGRVIFNRPNGVAATNSGKVFGSPNPLSAAVSNTPTTPNHASHYHNFKSGVGAPAFECAGENTCSTPNSIGGRSWFYDFISSTSTEDLIPFVVLRGCSPIATGTPTTSPTTSRPSKSPSRTPTTSRPSRNPSRSPTTSRPSRNPSRSPTTSRPSKNPSKSPTTSRPSKSPSRSPSKAPTTSRPSKSPSKSPTTSRPSSAPSTSPTTSRPSLSPSRLLTLVCRPSFSSKKAACTNRIRHCGPMLVQMKWAGKGCRRKGKAAGDGGCQCKGYCGYTCKGPCVRDKECMWKNNHCYVRKTGLPGGPILQCE